VGLVTSVISIYYYIRVVKMMVVKEPQEMSESVKNYPAHAVELTGDAATAGELDCRRGGHVVGGHSV
jgi:NADH:ubiquinone oxidoreductase subunit 2 (subunit N)